MSEYRKILGEFDSYEEYLENVNTSIDTNWWNEAKKNHSRSSYEHYLRFYPQGKYKDEAQKKVNTFNELEEKQRETKLWNQAIKNNNKSSYERYLNAYYNGIYANEAKLKIDEFIQLKKEKKLEEQRLRNIEIDREKEAWEKACKEDKSWSYSEYIENYPNGIYYDEAFSLFQMLNLEITLKLYPIKRLFLFYNESNFVGVIDRNKNLVIKANYKSIWCIGERFLVVEKEGEQGLYSIDGMKILELGNYNLRVDGGGYKTKIIKENHSNDDFIVTHITDDKQWIYNSNFMKIFDSSIIKIIDIKNDRFGYIDKNNKLLLKPIYKDIFLHKNGIGRIVKDGGRHGLFGLINNKFQVILEEKYGHISFNSNNPEYSIIRNYNWTKEGIINNQGKIIFDLIYDWILDIENGFFVVQKDRKYGLIDNNGKMVIDVNYDNITYLKEEKIFLIEKNNKFGFTDSKGKITIEAELDEIYEGYSFDYGKSPINTKHKSLFLSNMETPIKIRKNDKYGLMDKKGEYLLYPFYKYITYSTCIEKNRYIYEIREYSDDINFNKRLAIYSNETITTVLLKQTEVINITKLKSKLIEIQGNGFNVAIVTIDGKILLESKNPITYKNKKNEILKDYY